MKEADGLGFFTKPLSITYLSARYRVDNPMAVKQAVAALQRQAGLPERWIAGLLQVGLRGRLERRGMEWRRAWLPQEAQVLQLGR